MSRFIILDKEDVKSELHTNLWYNFLETLRLDKDTESIDLCLFKTDKDCDTEPPE